MPYLFPNMSVSIYFFKYSFSASSDTWRKQALQLFVSTAVHLFISNSATAILGYLPQELLGTSCYEYCHQDDHNHLAEKHKEGTKWLVLPGYIQLHVIAVWKQCKSKNQKLGINELKQS